MSTPGGVDAAFTALVVAVNNAVGNVYNFAGAQRVMRRDLRGREVLR